MAENFATDVANYSICGKTLQELIAQFEEQGLDTDKAQEAAILLARELMRQGVVLAGDAGGKDGEAALVAQISRSMGERRRMEETVQVAVQMVKTHTRAGAKVDHDALTPSEGGKPIIQMGDEKEQKPEKTMKAVRRKPPKGRGR